MATERWNRLRAWTGGLGRARRIASRSASSQRRATDQVELFATWGHAGARSHGRVAARAAPVTTTTTTRAAPNARARAPVGIIRFTSTQPPLAFPLPPVPR